MLSDSLGKTHSTNTASDKSASAGPKGTAIAPPAYGIKAIDKAYDSMSLEKAIKNLPNMTQGQAIAVLKKYQQSIIRSITTGETRIRELRSVRAEGFGTYLAGGAIELLGWTSLPSDNWDEPELYIALAYDTINRKQIKETLQLLISASDATLRHWDQLTKYQDRIDSSAKVSITGLKAVRDISFVVVGTLGTVVTGGVLGGALIGTGVTTLGTVAEQGTEASIGLREKIDWGGIAFDAVLGFALSMLGGKIAQRLGGADATRLAAQNPAVSEFLKAIGGQFSKTAWKEIVKRAVVNVAYGRAQSLIHTAARSLFDYGRDEKAQMTGSQFINTLVNQLLDPKGIFMDILGGEIGVLAHGYLAEASNPPVTTSDASLENRGYKPKPGERTTTKQEWKIKNREERWAKNFDKAFAEYSDAKPSKTNNAEPSSNSAMQPAEPIHSNPNKNELESRMHQDRVRKGLESIKDMPDLYKLVSASNKPIGNAKTTLRDLAGDAPNTLKENWADWQRGKSTGDIKSSFEEYVNKLQSSQARAEYGELSEAFERGQNELIVKAPKGANKSGTDLISYDKVSDRIKLIDNKAYKEGGTVSSVSALEQNLPKNLADDIADIQSQSQSPTTPPEIKESVLPKLQKAKSEIDSYLAQNPANKLDSLEVQQEFAKILAANNIDRVITTTGGGKKVNISSSLLSKKRV